MYVCNANKDSCNTFEARCNSTKDACIMQRIYIRRHFLYLRLKSVKELVNYNTRKTMKQKQKAEKMVGRADRFRGVGLLLYLM